MTFRLFFQMSLTYGPFHLHLSVLKSPQGGRSFEPCPNLSRFAFFTKTAAQLLSILSLLWAAKELLKPQHKVWILVNLVNLNLLFSLCLWTGRLAFRENEWIKEAEAKKSSYKESLALQAGGNCGRTFRGWALGRRACLWELIIFVPLGRGLQQFCTRGI